MLLELITRLAADCKYDVVEERAALVKLVNNAAREVYRLVEVNDLLRETILLVPPNRQVALPHFIGYAKGMREHHWYENFDMKSIATPRYVSDSWGESYWRQWRDKGISPVHTYTSNAGALTLVAPAIESPEVVVAITGETPDSARTTESVTMSAVSEVTANSFDNSKLRSIYCPTLRTYDIIIKDIAGTEIAKLHNNQVRTRYRIVDVGQFPFSIVSDANFSLVDLLYKVPYEEMLEDNDEFQSPPFEDAIYYKAMELWCKSQESRQNEAIGYFTNCDVVMRQAKKEIEGGENQVLKFEPNKLYGLHRIYSNKVVM